MRYTPHQSNSTHASRGDAAGGVLGHGGFTLIELLVVLAIIGLILALSLPNFRHLNEGKAMEGAARQLMSDLAYARQTAIATRSTVAVVFVNTNVFKTPLAGLTPAQKTNVLELQAGCYTTYAVLAFRQAGDQPGQPNRRYVTPWRTLPEKTFVAPWKLDLSFPEDEAGARSPDALDVQKFRFPTQDGPSVSLPYIAFNERGECVTVLDSLTGYGKPKSDVYVPLGQGAIQYMRDASGFVTGAPFVQEVPPGNSLSNSPTANLIFVDSLTGRARLERMDVTRQ